MQLLDTQSKQFLNMQKVKAGFLDIGNLKNNN